MKLSPDIAVMTRSRIIAASLISFMLVLTFASCDDDDKLESSTVTFSGTILYADFSAASNFKFEILVRTNPDLDIDTTIRVRIPVTTDASGQYNLIVHTDGFPQIPFYTVSPLSKSMVSLEVPNCPSRQIHQPVLLDGDNKMTARFGAAAFLRITFRKTEQSSATSALYAQCNQSIATTTSHPDTTLVARLPYDITPNPYSFSYIIMYSDFSAESRLAEVVLQPYDTTGIDINY